MSTPFDNSSASGQPKSQPKRSNYSGKPPWAEKPQPAPFKLNDDEKRELRIIKQSIIKSGIEGGQLVKNQGETDEQFVERWVKYVYREGEKDYKLAKEQDNPF